MISFTSAELSAKSFASQKSSNPVSWNVASCGFCKNRRFGGAQSFLFLHSMHQLLITVNVVSSSTILVTVMMEALRFSETSVLPRDTRRNIPEDGILNSHRRGNPKPYIALNGWAL
jgi:hypothetical protein